MAEAVDRSLLLVVEGFDGRTVPRTPDGEEDLGRQLEEVDIPDHSEKELDSFLKSKYLKELRTRLMTGIIKRPSRITLIMGKNRTAQISCGDLNAFTIPNDYLNAVLFVPMTFTR